MRHGVVAVAILVAVPLLLTGGAGAGRAGEPALVVASNFTTDLWGEIFAVGVDGRNKRNLTRSPYDDRAPAVDPSRKTIVFVSNRSGVDALWTMRADGSAMRRFGRLPTGYVPTGYAAPSWDSTGRWLLVQAQSKGRPAALFVVSRSGAVRRVAKGGLAMWAPDGRIAVAGSSSSTPYYVDVLTRTGRRLWRVPGFPVGWSAEGHLAAAIPSANLERSVIYNRAGVAIARFRGRSLAWSPTGATLAYTDPDVPLGGGRGRAWGLWLRRPGQVSRRLATRSDEYGFERSEVAWSPDGASLAYVLPGSKRPIVRLVDIATKRITPLSGLGPWSPDGQMIGFVGWAGGVFVARSGGGPARRIATDPAGIGWVTWLTRSRLLYTASLSGDNDADLFSIRRTGGIDRRLTAAQTWEGMASWSADGRSLAYSAGYPLCHAGHCSRYYDNDIWVRAADGSAPHRLTRTDEETGYTDDAWPAWSPDGREIAFVRTPRNRDYSELPPQLRIVPAAGGVSRQVAAPALTPAWSPDGSSIAFADPGGRLFVIGPDGSNRRELGARAVAGSRFSWSPDGSRIAFADTVGGLATVSVANGTVLPLGSADAKETVVAWSPDGSRVAFSGTGVGVVSVSSGSLTSIDAHAAATGLAWSPDSASIAYAVEGNVLVVPASGGRAVEAIPGPSEELDPAWARAG